MGSDFSCTLSEIDKKGGNPNSAIKLPVVKEINKFCNLYDLDDIWRQYNPNEEQFTWRNKFFKNTMSHTN